MSDTQNPDYLPECFGDPLEQRLERKQEIAELRKNTLSPIQAIFVNHFFESNCDISVSAARCGIKVGQARKWIEEPGPVFDLVAARLQEMAEQSKVTVAAIVDGLYNEANRMPVDTDDKTVSHAARVAAWSHLAKYKGMFDKGGKSSGKKIVVNIDIDGDANISGGETSESPDE